MGVMTNSVNPFLSLWILLRYIQLVFKCLKIPCFMPTCTLERKGHFRLPFSFILKKPPRSDKGPSGKLSYNDPLINIGPVPRSYITLMQKQTRKKNCLKKSQLFIILILSEGWKSMRCTFCIDFTGGAGGDLSWRNAQPSSSAQMRSSVIFYALCWDCSSKF